MYLRFLVMAGLFFLAACADLPVTAPEPLQLNHQPCTPDAEECVDHTQDPYPGAPGLWARGFTENECRNPAAYGPDGDLDGILDECEGEVAYRFAPELVYAVDCNYDAGNGRLGGDYAYAVQGQPDGGGLRIAYLNSYYEDCGVPRQGYPCCGYMDGAHSGDSEFISLIFRIIPQPIIGLPSRYLRRHTAAKFRVATASGGLGATDGLGQTRSSEGRQSYGSRKGSTLTIVAAPPAMLVLATRTPVIRMTEG